MMMTVISVSTSLLSFPILQFLNVLSKAMIARMFQFLLFNNLVKIIAVQLRRPLSVYVEQLQFTSVKEWRLESNPLQLVAVHATNIHLRELWYTYPPPEGKSEARLVLNLSPFLVSLNWNILPLETKWRTWIANSSWKLETLQHTKREGNILPRWNSRRSHPRPRTKSRIALLDPSGNKSYEGGCQFLLDWYKNKVASKSNKMITHNQYKHFT